MNRKKILGCLMVLILFMASSCLMAYGSDRANDDLGEAVNEIESALPLAEKQAEIIIKMLNDDNHLAKIKASISNIKSAQQSYVNKAIKDFYLYRVLEKLDVPIEKTAIHKRLFRTPESGSSDTIQILSPNIFRIIYFRAAASIIMDIYKTENFEKFVRVLDKVMAIQRPVLLLAKEKLGDTAFSSLSNGDHILNLNKKYNDWSWNNYTHSNLLKELPNFALIHLKSVAKYIDELDIEEDSGYRKRKWADFSKEIDDVLASRAEMEGLESLKVGEKPKEKTYTTPNLDDLKLPK